MWALLPLASLVLAVLTVYRRTREFRWSVLVGALFIGAIGSLSVEAFSLFRAIRFTPLAVFWGVVCAVWAALLLRRPPPVASAAPAPAAPTLGEAVAEPSRERWTAPYIGLVVVVVLLLAATAVVALVAPPNNHDSMTYHMARVAHWVQNGHVDPYPTAIKRQIQMSPGAEYLILHLQVLACGDRFASLVQWLAFAGSLLAASLMARALGAGYRGQVLAAVFCATLPMALLQASSTQNDLLAGFWLLTAACAAARVSKVRDTRGVIGCGLAACTAFGLAILTKGTSMPFGLPVGLWFLSAVVRRLGAASWKPLLVAGAIGVLLVSGYYVRNVTTFKRLTGEAGAVNVNKSQNPKAIASNVVRNTLAHFATPSRAVNAKIVDLVEAGHRALGVDPADPRTTFRGRRFELFVMSTDEDRTGNPLHLVLLWIAAGAVLFGARLRRNPTLLWAVLIPVFGFGLYCVAVKWQPWCSRLHTPAFMLAAAGVGTVLASWRRPRLALAVAWVLVAACVPWAVHNHKRPLVGERSIFYKTRAELYRSYRPIEYQQFEKVMADNGARNIGLFIGRDSPEYILWGLLGALEPGKYRIEHMEPPNRTAQFADPEFRPEVIIQMQWGTPRPREIAGVTWVKKWGSRRLALMVPE